MGNRDGSGWQAMPWPRWRYGLGLPITETWKEAFLEGTVLATLISGFICVVVSTAAHGLVECVFAPSY